MTSDRWAKTQKFDLKLFWGGHEEDKPMLCKKYF